MTFDAVGVFGLTFDFLLKICLSILWCAGTEDSLHKLEMLRLTDLGTKKVQNLKL